MGAKYAGIHFRTDAPDTVLPVFKKIFNKKVKPDKQDEELYERLVAYTNERLNRMTDREAIKEAQQMYNNLKFDWSHGFSLDFKGIFQHKTPAEMKRITGNEAREMIRADVAFSRTGRFPGDDFGAPPPNDRAAVVLRKHFVSLYWDDRIRPNNMEKELCKYAKKLKMPALGISVFKDNNVVFHAVRDIGKESERECIGFYWFDEEDIKPIKASDLCQILDADFLLEALTETLSCEDGVKMAETFERTTGIMIFENIESCRDAGMMEVDVWESADVFREGSI